MDEQELQRLNDFLAKNPNASDDDVLKAFPSMKGDKATLKSAYGYVYGLSQGSSPRMLKRYYPELFATPLTEHQQMLNQAEGTLESAYKQHGDQAIDYLSQKKSDQNFYNSRQQQAQKQDATYMPMMAPRMSTQDLAAQRDAYRQQNPAYTKEVAQTIGYTNPQIKPQLDAALYLKDREAAGDTNTEKQVATAKKIAEGKAFYNSQNGQLTKHLGPLDSIAYGWKSRQDALNGYDFVTSHPDADVIKHFNEKALQHDPNEPQPRPYGLGEFTAPVGSESVPMGAMIGGDIVGGAAGQPEVAGAGTAFALRDYYKRDYYGNLERLYWEGKQKGLSDQEALSKAKDNAEFAAKVGIAKNAAMIGAVGRLADAGNLVKAEDRGLVNTFMEGTSAKAKQMLKEGAVVGGVAAAGKAAQNVKEGKNTTEGVLDEGLENGALAVGLGTIIHGAVKTLGIPVKAVRAAKQFAAKVDPAEVNAELGEMIKDGSITPEQAKGAEQAIAEHKAVDAQIPSDVTDQNARMDIQEVIEKKQELEDKAKTLNSAYKPELKEKIAKYDEKINELTDAAKKTQRKARQFQQAAAQTEPILEARHGESEFDANNKVSGQSTEPLSDKGKAAANELADEVSDHDINKVITSDLPRAKETAQIVSEKTGVPVEERPELRSWDLGEFSGTDEKEFKPVQKYLVEHPDATEYEGKKVNESFNQYKDRIIKAREDLDGEKDALVINHSNNMGVWDAYKKNGMQWNEDAVKDYLSGKNPEPAKLRSREAMENYVADHFEDDVKPEELVTKVKKAIKKVKKNEQPVEQVPAGAEQETGSGEVNGETGRANKEESGENGVPPVDEGKSTGGGEPVSGDRSAPDEVRVDKYGVRRGKHNEPLEPEIKVKQIPENKESREKIEYAKRNSYREYKKKYPEDDVDTYTYRRVGLVLPKEGDVAESKGQIAPRESYRKPTEAIDKILEAHPDNELFKRTAEFLKPILKNNPKVHIDTEADFNKLEYKGKKLNPDAYGYQFPEGKVAINFDKIGDNPEGLHATILHELMHAATRSEIERNPEFKAEIRKNLEYVRDQLKVPVKGSIGDTLIPHLVSEGIIEPSKYGTANEHELISELFSNEKFRDMLRNIKAPDSTPEAPKSMLQKMFESIVKFFNKSYGALKQVKGEIKASDMADYLTQLTEKTIRPKDEGGIGDVHASISRKREKIEIGKEGDEARTAVREALDESKKHLEALKNDPAYKALVDPNFLQRTHNVAKRWFWDTNDNVNNAKSIILEAAGKVEHDAERIWHESEKVLMDWWKVPKEQRLAFFAGMENPELRKSWGPKELKLLSDQRERYDAAFQGIKKIIPGLNYIEDYFMRLWKDPEKARNFFAGALSKRPLEGMKTFSHKRTLSDMLEGLRAGLELVTDNPEELLRLHETMFWQLRKAHEIIDGVNEEGLLKSSASDNVPRHWKSIDDPLFNRIGAYVNDKGEAKIAKVTYLAPPEVAKLLNDYLSKGMGDFKKPFQAYNNLMNQFQMGFSGFHYMTTGLESNVTSTTTGIQKITSWKNWRDLVTGKDPKKLASGLLDFVKTATFASVPIEQYIRATIFKKAYRADKLSEGMSGMQDALDHFIKSNGKISQQKLYTLDAIYNMRKAFSRTLVDKEYDQLVPGAKNLLAVTPEAMSHHLMNQWVPNLKIGGFLKGFESETMVRPDMTPTEKARAASKIWSSMDDRLGQMTYDNLFMNKTAKDILFAVIRSFGWSGGTVRTIIKGVGEIPLSMKRLVKGEGLTQNTAYLLALPITIGFYGALIHKIMSGNNPETLEDYFFPKDGSKNSDGTDHRIVLPSYLKDWISYSNSPLQTIGHKTSPLINSIIETISNKDFYGEQIYNPKDKFFQQGIDVLNHQVKGLTPFSLGHRPDETSIFEDPTMSKARQFIGIMPAPRERERSETQNAITQAFAEQVDNGKAATHAELEQRVARRHLRQYIHDGGSLDDAPEDMVKKANIDEKQRHKFESDAKLDPYTRYFKQLKKETKIELFNKMTPEEKEQYKEFMPKDYNEDEK